ncbi:MAG: NADH-quinone oxidoreductase subunit J [Candidatus Schekmanbacteria bacterium]|nr:NADH-quinone oxidoreductase subunit J [Candidatus Schekmanbacteria bacterium]
MDISPVFFYLFAGLAIAFSVLVVLKKSPVASAFCLVVVFFMFAGIYALLDAHLIAAVQVLVYAGAIMVLFVFVIMLLNADSPSFDLGRSHLGLRVGAVAACVVLLGLFVYAFRASPLQVPPGALTAAQIDAAGGNTRVISRLMFSEYILPFELTSVLLLAGIVGAVAIAKRKLGAPEGTA